MQRQFPDDLVTARKDAWRFPRFQRRNSVVQADRLPRQFAVCREEPPEPRTLEMPKPAGKGGPEHPAEGRGNSVTWTIQSIPNSGPFRKTLFLATGMLVPAS